MQDVNKHFFLNCKELIVKIIKFKIKKFLLQTSINKTILTLNVL